MQRVRNLPAQRFRPHPFIREHFENINELARRLADLHERHVDGGEVGGMLGDRLCETFSRQNAGADFVYNRAQSSEVIVVGEQLQPSIEAGASLEQQGEIARKNSDVFHPWPIEEADRVARNGGSAFFGGRFDWNETKIFDAVGDFSGSRRQNRSVHELAALGHRKVAKIPHRITVWL